MKRIFAWLIMSLMGITAVMPSFVPFAKQDETPSVVQVQKEEEKEDVTPTVVPDEPTPEPDAPKVQPVTFDDQDYVVKSAFSRITNGNGISYVEVAQEDRRSTDELPTQYTQIEYLESTGSQWIDTGYIPKNNTIIECSFLFPTGGEKYIFGSPQHYGWPGEKAFTLCNNPFAARIGGVTQNIPQQTNKNYNVYFSTENVIVDIDGTETTYAINKTFTESNQSLYLFRSYYVSTGFKLYSFKISEKNTETGEMECKKDFVPCLKDGLPGLYDVVEQAFYGNKSSGYFNSINNLSGNGTESDPYQIASVEELISMGAINNSSKYYILTQDISFNDGYFTENNDGTCTYHDGGDGVLYDWGTNTTLFKSFDGQNHTIKNFYSTGYALFAFTNTGGNQYISNIKMIDAYVNTNKSTAILCSDSSCTCSPIIMNCEVQGWLYTTATNGYNVIGSGLIFGTANANRATLENCIARGSIYSKGFASGIGGGTFSNCINYATVTGSRAAGMAGNIWGALNCTDCKNYGKITSTQYAGGMGGGTVGGTFKNCHNYGEIISTANNGRSAGIVAESINGGTYNFYNCGNEGDVSASGSYAAGISSLCTANINRVKKVQYCYNKGKIIAKGSSGFAFGITGMVDEAVGCENYGTISSIGRESAGCFIYVFYSITDCKNYGVVNGASACGIYDTNFNSAIVTNCINYGTVKGSTSGGINISCNSSVKLQQCQNYGQVIGSSIAGGIWARRGNYNISISNCANFGDVSGKTCGGISGSSGGSYVTIKNCLSTGNLTGTTCYPLCPTSTLITNCIANCNVNGTDRKQYYGTDFSKFFYTWKEERIGLIALERNGLYRGQLTEKFLYERGFEPQDGEPSEEYKEYIEREKQKNFQKYYTQLEYLESTGTQWIDTGVSTNINTKVICDFAITDTRTSTNIWPAIFGAQNQGNSADGKNFVLGYTPSALTISGRAQVVQISGTSNTNYDIGQRYSAELSNEGFIVDGNKIHDTFVWNGDFNCKMFIFTRGVGNSTTSNDFKAYCKIYSFKIYDNETLVRDFVPAMRKSDQVLGLYDKVQGKFYTNQGTGTFLGA